MGNADNAPVKEKPWRFALRETIYRTATIAPEEVLPLRARGVARGPTL